LFELQAPSERIILRGGTGRRPRLFGAGSPVFVVTAGAARQTFTASLFAPLATGGAFSTGFIAAAAFAARRRSFFFARSGPLPFTAGGGAIRLAPRRGTVSLVPRCWTVSFAARSGAVRALFAGAAPRFGTFRPRGDFLATELRFARLAGHGFFPVPARRAFSAARFAPAARFARGIRPSTASAVPIPPSSTSAARIAPVPAVVAGRGSGPELADIGASPVAIRRSAPVPAFERVPEFVFVPGGGRSGRHGGRELIRLPFAFLALFDRFRRTAGRGFEDRFDPGPLRGGFVDFVEQAPAEVAVVKEIVVVILRRGRRGRGAGHGSLGALPGSGGGGGRRSRRIEIAEVEPLEVERIADRPLRIEMDSQEVGSLRAQGLIRVVAR